MSGGIAERVTPSKPATSRFVKPFRSGGSLTLLVLGCTALAQETPPQTGGPANPIMVADAMTGYSTPLFPADGPAGGGGRFAGNHKFPNFINWLGNPVQNIDPRAVTAIYPIFGSSWFSTIPPLPDGDMQVYAPAITVALSERLAVGLSQGGYADLHHSRNQLARLLPFDPLGQFRDFEAGGHRTGWLNFGGFAQYTLIEDCDCQFLLTAGLRWEAPWGSHAVFQGFGPWHLAHYLTAGKEFGEFHILATAGYQFPAGSGDFTTNLFYANVHLDRRCFGWLYPVVEFGSEFSSTSFDLGRITRRGGILGLVDIESEGTVVSLAAGANAVLVPERLEVGAVYTTVIASQRNLDVNGLIVKMTLRF
jgi:hypothetical protein